MKLGNVYKVHKILVDMRIDYEISYHIPVEDRIKTPKQLFMDNAAPR